MNKPSSELRESQGKRGLLSQFRHPLWQSRAASLDLLTFQSHNPETGLGDVRMRLSWLVFILVPALAFSVTYQVLDQLSPPNSLPESTDDSQQYPIGQKGDRLPPYRSEVQLQASDLLRVNFDPKEVRTGEGQTPQGENHVTGTIESPDLTHTTQNLSYLAYYAYSEVPPETKPADTVMKALEDIPRGTPVEEIKRVANVFGLDFNFMRAVAKIESDFDPKQRTGSYIGLYQLSNAEFEKYGSGDIRDARDNAVAAAYKFMTETILFEISTHRKATLADLYLIHQQGVQGAAEHVSHPDRLAWKSMCATDEGREKGERWCKRAIWGNTLPAIKHVWKTVDNITSGAFVGMWQQRVSQFYSRYSEATAN